MTARKRRETRYDVDGVGTADAHALEVSALVRELQAHLDRLRRDEASVDELSAVSRMLQAVRRARRDEGGC